MSTACKGPFRWAGWRAAAIAFAFSPLLIASPHSLGATSGDSPRQLTITGGERFRKGDFAGAIADWSSALRQYESAGDAQGCMDVLADLAAADQRLGQYKAARKKLEQALQLAESAHDKARIVSFKTSLGSVLTFMRQWQPRPSSATTLPASGVTVTDAQTCLAGALATAEELGDKVAQARVLNARGTLRVVQGRSSDAVSDYRHSAQLAREANDASLAATALANAASAAAAVTTYVEAAQLNAEAIEIIASQDDSYDKAHLLLTAGQTYQQILSHDSDSRTEILQRARDIDQKALVIARRLGAPRLESYALGHLGQLYSIDGQGQTAIELTRRAAFIAQQIQAPELLYRWQWQIGRLMRLEGHAAQAIQTYRLAIATLESARYDLSIGYGNRVLTCSFRDSVGPLFFEFADLLLQSADHQSNAQIVEATLKEARAALELLKTTELQDYFREECVSIARNKQVNLDQVAASTAIIYVIPLPDRTELLVSCPAGLRRFKSPAKSGELEEQVRLMRRQLEQRTSQRYLRTAAQLHRWLIEPIEQYLKSEKIDTLVFVPDGALRTIPMAALHDGQSFLIQRYAIAVSPGLTLMEPRPLPHQGVEVFIGGLTEAHAPFPSLTFVPAELGSIQELYGGRQLLNRDFVVSRFQEEMMQAQYTIVHIASHGQFGSDAKDTFVLAHDKPLTLDQLERLIQPSQFRGSPVELLTLSACQTAAGDDRAALGLAGVAVKAGARSAVATLWFVNDEASARLTSDFYRLLRTEPTLSRAKAMQKAQLRLLTDYRYRHPCYWSPYLIIGNWL